MLIYVPKTTPRIFYTFKIIFERLLNVSLHFTTDIDEFLVSTEPKMAYSSQKIEASVWMEATALLFEENIMKQNINTEKWGGYSLFFPVKNGNFSIDFASVIFFLVSRYEEYDNAVLLDKHKRFSCKNSIAHTLGWHRTLMTHRLAFALAEEIKKYFPQFVYKTPQFVEFSTHDVDIAYQYKGKQWWRLCGAFAKSIFTLRFTHAQNCLKTALGIDVVDPFDNFEPENVIPKPIYFIPTASFGKYDKNISVKSNAFRRLICKIKEHSEIGLHPSYHSSENKSFIEKEKKKLEKVSQLTITKSRQHFLRFRFPDTFRALLEAGITDDYSLGWHDDAGFRASIAVPYPFFDLLKNEETALMLHPLAFMDCVFAQEEGSSVLSELREEAKKMGGNLIVLTHNSYLQ